MTRQLRELLSRRLLAHVESHVLAGDELRKLVDRIGSRTLDPYTAVEQILARVLGPDSRP